MPPHAVYHDGWNNCVWLVKIKSVFAKGKSLGKAKCAKKAVFCYVFNKTKVSKSKSIGKGRPQWKKKRFLSGIA